MRLLIIVAGICSGYSYGVSQKREHVSTCCSTDIVRRSLNQADDSFGFQWPQHILCMGWFNEIHEVHTITLSQRSGCSSSIWSRHLWHNLIQGYAKRQRVTTQFLFCIGNEPFFLSTTHGFRTNAGVKQSSDLGGGMFPPDLCRATLADIIVFSLPHIRWISLSCKPSGSLLRSPLSGKAVAHNFA